ncbi:MAG TPA: type I polyketide synthase, partial [Solirubrobacteraceae bacterium]
MGDGSAIAVIGMACRVPGASSPAELWTLLGKGQDAVGDMPEQRRALIGEPSGLAASGEEQLSREEILLARRGGWLEHIETFDPGFFGISPREAAAMDPQQRLMLELCWEAFEDAGSLPAANANETAGVFVGAISNDYADLMLSRGGDAITRHALTGSHRSMIANRVSYTLGLRGPSMTVDTGQSSSLVAVHLACESLRRGESKLALAGGVHLNVSPSSALAALRFGGLSPDGRCFTFDARANGYVRGEGGGVALLRPLSDALEADDPIYAVIRSSALNNDGGGDGLTAPSQRAQEEVLRLAYRRSAIKRSAVRYVELHGTGTKLGDRVEAGALGAVLGATRPADSPLAVGSVKTNIGHLEGAAGILGLIKTVLCIERGAIPSSLNFQAPPADVPLGELGLSVQQALAPWPAEDEPLYAGVSSFGLGGTNCHVVLAEPPARDGTAAERREGAARQESPKCGPLGEGVRAWTISARDDAALRHQADRVAEHAEGNAEVGVAEVARTLALGRQAFDRRVVVLGEDRADLLEGLRAVAAGKPDANALEGVATPAANRGVVFVFPGQGSQWVGMAAGLLRHSPVFAERIRACTDALSKYIDWSVEEVLLGSLGAPSLERVDVVQPALFAVMVSLAELWRACGVRPAAVVGHSQGEVVAAHL